MGHGRHPAGTYYGIPPAPAPPPVADYNVTGDITPDATCNYFYAGEHNGKPYYRRGDSAWFNYWVGLGWWISAELGYEGGNAWYRFDPDIVGDYNPVSPSHTGIATVSSGPH